MKFVQKHKFNTTPGSIPFPASTNPKIPTQVNNGVVLKESKPKWLNVGIRSCSMMKSRDIQVVITCIKSGPLLTKCRVFDGCNLLHIAGIKCKSVGIWNKPFPTGHICDSSHPDCIFGVHEKSTLFMRQSPIRIFICIAQRTAAVQPVIASKAICRIIVHHIKFRGVRVVKERPEAQGAYGIGLRRCTHRQKSQQKNDFLLHNIFLFYLHITSIRTVEGLTDSSEKSTSNWRTN